MNLTLHHYKINKPSESNKSTVIQYLNTTHESSRLIFWQFTALALTELVNESLWSRFQIDYIVSLRQVATPRTLINLGCIDHQWDWIIIKQRKWIRGTGSFVALLPRITGHCGYSMHPLLHLWNPHRYFCSSQKLRCKTKTLQKVFLTGEIYNSMLRYIN